MFNIFLQMIINLVLTIIIEVSFSLILGIRNRKDIYSIIFINCVTNIVLNYIMNIIKYFVYSNILIYIILTIFEIVVVLIEYKYYQKNLEYKRINPLILSIILNILSFGTGLLIYNL